MSVFKFKQFSITQEKSAMKISTDSVILGAWINSIKSPKTVLDIGSGTGLLSLMVAQHFPNSIITAIEIEQDAFEETVYNFAQAKWHKNLNAIHTSLQNFNPKTSFDFIITNPPYFVNSLHNQSNKKTTARHTSALSFQDIIHFVKKHLDKQGNLALILPINEFKQFQQLAEKQHLFLINELLLKPNHKKPINRVCGLFSFQKTPKTSTTLQVRNELNLYTSKHKELTQAFYLDK